jgi:prolipoprotein diacylglyceryltransferase
MIWAIVGGLACWGAVIVGIVAFFAVARGVKAPSPVKQEKREAA